MSLPAHVPPRDRRFGSVDGAALVVATVVGAGIFTVPSYVASLAHSPVLVLALWAAGGLMAMAGALCYAELAARLPRGGAEYAYLREAFGPTAGFLSGWTSFVAGFSGAIAAAAVGFARHLGQVAPATAEIPPALIALALIATFTLVSVAGIRASRLATNMLAAGIVAGLMGMIAAMLLGAGHAAGPSVAAAMENGGAGEVAPGAALSALVPIFFTYSGWNAAAYVAGEFREPSRTVPRALIGGTLIVTLLYVGLNASLVRALSVPVLSASGAAVSDGARSALGGWGATLVGALVLFALASSVCAMVVTGPRIYREMARDGVLPSLFGRVRGRDEAPVTAALAQSAWSAVLVLTGTFEQIVTYTGFAIMLFSALAVGALFVLRRRHGVPATYRVPWYPAVPAAFVLASLGIAASSFRYAPGPSFAGLLIIALGWLLLRASRAGVRA